MDPSDVGRTSVVDIKENVTIGNNMLIVMDIILKGRRSSIVTHRVAVVRI